MLSQLKILYDQNIIRAIDYHFALFIHKIDTNPIITLIAAWVSYRLGAGDVCVDLNELQHKPLFDESSVHQKLIKLNNAPTNEWASIIQNSSAFSNEQTAAPLVFQDSRIYLRRYWLYEQTMINFLERCMKKVSNAKHSQLLHTGSWLDTLFCRNYERLYKNLQQYWNATNTIDPSDCKQALIEHLDINQQEKINWQPVQQCIHQSLLNNTPKTLTALDLLIPKAHCLNWQKVAAAMATSGPFTVISGGPGTGKTTTVVRLLAVIIPLLQEEKKQLPTLQQLPIVNLAAPTGKAAARLSESVSQAINDLPCDPAVKNLIPKEAVTLHALLGASTHEINFKRNKDNPLPLDMLIVDEASMIDAPMMAHLLEALPEHARLILLGDHHQLASVEAGGILSALCSGQLFGYSDLQKKRIHQLTGYVLPTNDFSNKQISISDHVCVLQKSYRFHATSGIGKLATAVNHGNESDVIDLLTQCISIHMDKTYIAKNHEKKDLYPDIIHLKPNSSSERMHNNRDFIQAVIEETINSYTPFLQAVQKKAPAEQVLTLFNQARLLCVTREGVTGVYQLNTTITQVLQARNFITAHSELWFAGRPVLINKNDYDTGLCNGDIGITLPDENGRLKVYFKLSDGRLHCFMPSRLPEHETAFAMTIHKSQGSEFDHTLLVLPERHISVAGRELLYTGITRAKKKLTLMASTEIILTCVKQQCTRISGLNAFVRDH